MSGIGSGRKPSLPALTARIADTRMSSPSIHARSVVGARARTRAAPAGVAARPATRESTSGSSRTRSAWGFMRTARALEERWESAAKALKGLSAQRSASASPAPDVLQRSSSAFSALLQRFSSAPALSELLSSDGVDRSALSPAFELGHHLPHHRTDVRGSVRDRGADGGANLVIAYLGRQVLLEGGDLGALLVGEVRTTALVVRLDRLAPPLDSFPQDFDDVLVGGIATELDLPVLDVGQDGAEEERSQFVLSLAGRVEIGLEAGEESRHIWKLEIATGNGKHDRLPRRPSHATSAEQVHVNV